MAPSNKNSPQTIKLRVGDTSESKLINGVEIDPSLEMAEQVVKAIALQVGNQGQIIKSTCIFSKFVPNRSWKQFFREYIINPEAKGARDCSNPTQNYYWPIVVFWNQRSQEQRQAGNRQKSKMHVLSSKSENQLNQHNIDLYLVYTKIHSNKVKSTCYQEKAPQSRMELRSKTVARKPDRRSIQKLEC